MNLYNFSHPLTDANIDEINALLAKKHDALRFTRADIRNIPSQVDQSAALVPQIRNLFIAAHYQDGENKENIYLRLPGQADVAAGLLNECVAAYTYANCIRLASVPNSTPTTYKVVEINIYV